MSCLYACARPRRSPASSHSRSRRGLCAPPARPGTEAGATALEQHPFSPRPHGEPCWPRCSPRLGPAPRPPPCLTPQPHICLAFPVCGAGCPESVPRGGGGEPCGPSPAHGALDKPESRLPGFVWDLSGSPWDKRDTVLLSVFRGSLRPLAGGREPARLRQCGVPSCLPGCSVLPAAPAPGRAHHTLLCGCCLTRVTAKMELLLYKKLIKRRT